LLGHSMGGMVARRVVLARPDRIDALVLMDTSAGPPPGIDPDLVRLGAEVALRDGMSVLRVLLEQIDPLGSAAHQRVVAERPGFREYGDYKWSALSPVMWSALAVGSRCSRISSSSPRGRVPDTRAGRRGRPHVPRAIVPPRRCGTRRSPRRDPRGRHFRSSRIRRRGSRRSTGSSASNLALKRPSPSPGSGPARR
jgi:pimeloyl-ACP methyl ester carboxylesterase